MAKIITTETNQIIEASYKAKVPLRRIASENGISYTYVWVYTRGRELGFKSVQDYLNFRARERGKSSARAYEKELLRKKGFFNEGDYRQYLANQQGFSSRFEQQHYAGKRASENPENQKLSRLIRDALKELGKTNYWLAQQIGVSALSAANYSKGKAIPRPKNLRKLFLVLKVPFKSLEELMAQDKTSDF